MNAIFDRRSIRKFTDKKISEHNLDKLLKAAMAAPSGCNVQPWEYLVIRNKKTMEKIMEFHEYSKMLKTADTVILACGSPVKGHCEKLWPQDLSASVQNILLEATYLKIGSCWLGVYPREDLIKELRSLLDLPDNIIPFALVALGYPNEDKEPNTKYKKNKVHLEKW